MKVEQAKLMLPIIEAYANGKEIEVFDGNTWNTVRELYLINKVEEYRIKPEAKLVPFEYEDAEMFRDEWVKDNTNAFRKIVGYDDESVYFGYDYIGYDVFLSDYKFEDGTPCGKYINE